MIDPSSQSFYHTWYNKRKYEFSPLMTHTAIALYLGESYATTCAFDLLNPKSSVKDSQPEFEKSVYLPQTSLKSLMAQAAAALPDTPVKSVFVVTRYMDRLKSFRLGGSVIQVVPEGFENSYSLTNTQQQSLAAPALILPIQPSATEESLAADLARLKKVNSEINKVVFQMPEAKELKKKFFRILKTLLVPKPKFIFGLGISFLRHLKILICISAHNASLKTT